MRRGEPNRLMRQATELTRLDRLSKSHHLIGSLLPHNAYVIFIKEKNMKELEPDFLNKNTLLSTETFSSFVTASKQGDLSCFQIATSAVTLTHQLAPSWCDVNKVKRESPQF
jgi:hypothetical protein